MRALGLFGLVTGLAGCVAMDGGGGDDDAFCSIGDPSSCNGEDICVAGACVSAFGRVYVISGIEVTMPVQDSSGEAWDVAGGAPDPKVIISLNGDVILTTDAAQDIFSASFPDTVQFSLPAGSVLELLAADEDLTFDDPAFSCVADPLSASLLRGGALACDVAGGGSLFAEIAPR